MSLLRFAPRAALRCSLQGASWHVPAVGSEFVVSERVVYLTLPCLALPCPAMPRARVLCPELASCEQEGPRRVGLGTGGSASLAVAVGRRAWGCLAWLVGGARGRRRACLLSQRAFSRDGWLRCRGVRTVGGGTGSGVVARCERAECERGQRWLSGHDRSRKEGSVSATEACRRERVDGGSQIAVPRVDRPTWRSGG